MSIHDLRLQFDNSFFAVMKDLVKLEGLEKYHIPPSDDTRRDLEEHLAAHTAMTLEVARLTSPTKTFVRV